MAMIGLDSYTATKGSLVGVDWLNLASGALKTAGGASAALDATGKPAEQAAVDRAKLEQQKKAAEASASTWKKVGIGGLVVVALGGLWWWHKK